MYDSEKFSTIYRFTVCGAVEQKIYDDMASDIHATYPDCKIEIYTSGRVPGHVLADPESYFKAPDKNQVSVLVLDDLQTSPLFQSREGRDFVTKLASTYCHHLRITTYLICQSIFADSMLLHLRNNANYIFLMGGSGGRTLSLLQAQYLPGQKKAIIEAYKSAMKSGSKHAYLLIDQYSSSNDGSCHLRSGVSVVVCRCKSLYMCTPHTDLAR